MHDYSYCLHSDMSNLPLVASSKASGASAATCIVYHFNYDKYYVSF